MLLYLLQNIGLTVFKLLSRIKKSQTILKTKNMKKEIAEIWIKELESGKYKQTKGVLKKDDSYCCLGVLCQISGLGEFKQVLGDEIISYVLPSGDMSSSILPDEVLNWADITDPYGNFDEPDSFSSLSILNDSGKTFTEIAKIIRAKYKIL